ncbi:MAG: hypothetical protein ACOX1H_03000 [Pseudoramibacter sp.]
MIYRERVYQRETYSLTHSVGYHYYLKDGSRVAIVVYTCIDEGISAHQRAELNSETAFRSFLNHSDIAIAVVKQVDGELVYCNQSMRGILHPVNNFDTGMTLAEYVKGQRDPALLGHIAALAGKGNQLAQIGGTGCRSLRVTAMDLGGAGRLRHRVRPSGIRSTTTRSPGCRTCPGSATA